MNDIELEVKEKMILSDGMKYLIYYLRKNNFRYVDIADMINSLIHKQPYTKTLKSIFVSINNRLLISSAYKNSNLTFQVINLLMNLIIHHTVKLKDKLGYNTTLTMINMSNYNFLNALKYVLRTEGKDLNFHLDIVFSYEGKVKGKMEQTYPTMSITFNEPLKLIEHLAYLEYRMHELLIR